MPPAHSNDVQMDDGSGASKAPVSESPLKDNTGINVTSSTCHSGHKHDEHSATCSHEHKHDASLGTCGHAHVDVAAPSNGGNADNNDDDAKSDTPVEAEPITYYRLGVDHPVDETASEFVITHGRIKTIENLEKCVKLKKLKIIASYINKLQGLDNLVLLEHLELYQNNVPKIENIAHLTNLVVLDISFNQVRKIENLDTLVNLEKLFLSSNKIVTIEGVDKLTKLKFLELGNNRIRCIENIGHLQNLDQLWLGKNKLMSMTIPPLKCLESTSMQSNRLTTWCMTIFTTSVNLRELYLSHNKLPDLPDEITEDMLPNLEMLDLGANELTKIGSIRNFKALKDLWINDNQIKSAADIADLKHLPKLETIYLERNPIYHSLGPGYRACVLAAVPWVTQIDALYLNTRYNLVSGASTSSPSQAGKSPTNADAVAQALASGQALPGGMTLTELKGMTVGGRPLFGKVGVAPKGIMKKP